MPSCEMCGKEERLLKVEVEGAVLSVCKECAKFGKIISSPVTFIKKEKVTKIVKAQKPEPFEIIVPGYGKLVKKKREELGLKQEELAKKIAEKETLIQKIETEQIEPSIEVARKLERFLGIKIVEEYEEKGGALSTKTKTAEFTIGDLMKRDKK
ncbi:MAG: multiprotein bridging factor aMBF1 [Candidatus Woesearchaeota archaeon]|nr:multiprotein bridging factor aMBF1 [Candidatus Woesearchaeota archaeon]